MIDACLDENERIVFHSTSAQFSEFDGAKLGCGQDNNSALGFFFSDDVASIPLYLRNSRDLVVAAVRVAKPVSNWSYYEIFGYDENGREVMSKDDFTKKRQDLIAEGYDSIEYADNEEAMLIALQPETIRILTRLNESEARHLTELISALSDAEDDQARLECVRLVVSASQPPQP